ncbi:hypothetical protein ACA910_000488 [Epithemia clementina (nom. ined.)]
MKVVTGDLLRLAKEGKFDVIVHGCNCFCSFGAGIAKSIKEEFPQAFEADCTTVPGERAKLGSMTAVKVPIVVVPRGQETTTSRKTKEVCEKRELVIVNAYTQFHWRRKKGECLLDYDALRSVFGAIKKQYAGLRIAYPKIGAGLAGGDWKLIAEIIDRELEGEDHTYVEYNRLSRDDT